MSEPVVNSSGKVKSDVCRLFADRGLQLPEVRGAHGMRGGICGFALAILTHVPGIERDAADCARNEADDERNNDENNRIFFSIKITQ